MDFDFASIPVPFRMQPGLRKLAPGTRQLTPLAPSSRLWAERRAQRDAGQQRLVVPGFDPAPALDAIARHAREHGIEPADGVPLELAYEEDFAVLEAEGGTLPWLCVNVPSHWAPEEKLGLPFAAVHTPVADAQLLRAASAQLVQLATSGDAWERSVWTITPSGRYDQHPKRHLREPWPDTVDVEAFARGCWLRTERQTFIPVRDATPRQAVFTIRVMLAPLAQAVDTADKAQRLHDSIASMSDAVLAYKSLAGGRNMLLRWLAQRGA